MKTRPEAIFPNLVKGNSQLAIGKTRKSVDQVVKNLTWAMRRHPPEATPALAGLMLVKPFRILMTLPGVGWGSTRLTPGMNRLSPLEVGLTGLNSGGWGYQLTEK